MTQSPRTLFAILHSESEREEFLIRTLDSVYRQKDAELSVLLVDRSSSNKLEATLKNRYPEIIYLAKSENTGIASGRNASIEYFLQSGFELFFILDNDIELEDDCLSLLIRALHQSPSIGFVAPLMFDEEGKPLSAGGKYIYPLGQPVLSREKPARQKEIDFASGSIGLFKRETIEATGDFDVEFDPYGFEDIDYGLRVKVERLSLLIEPEARCRHLSVYSFHRETEFFLFHTTKNRFYCASKHLGGASFYLIFFPWYVARRLIFPGLRFLAAGRANLLGAAIRGFFAGLRAVGKRKKLAAEMKFAENPSLESQGVPILCYHNVSDTKYKNFSLYTLPVSRFKTQMRWLKRLGYRSVSLDVLYDHLANGKPIPNNAVVLTFDDGYRDLQTTLSPWLAKMELVHTLFVNSGKMGGTTDWIPRAPDIPILSAEEIKEMNRLHGDWVDFQAHGKNHLALKNQSPETVEKEVMEDIQSLESILNRPVNYLAFPFGYYDADSVACAAKTSLRAAFTVDQGLCQRGQNLHSLPRVEILGNDWFIDFIMKLVFGWSPIAKLRTFLKMTWVKLRSGKKLSQN